VFKPIDFDFVLVQQMFKTSFAQVEPQLTINLGDIVYIYNNLNYLADKIMIPNH